MKKLVTIVLLFCAVLANAESDKKYTRLKAKADRFYNNFIYPKAVEFYEKAIGESSSFDAQAHLKIADSYRLMNNALSAAKWYEKIEHHGIMTDQDRMNYAQILLKNGNSEKAKEIMDSMESFDETEFGRLSDLDDVESYYVDSMAYLVENMAINSEDADFSPTYYEDGFVFVSNRKNGKLNQNTYSWDDTYFLDLYYSKISEDTYEEPEVMTKRINTIFHEGPAVFFDNDTKIIFTRNNFNLGRTNTSVEGVNMLKLYYAEKNPKNGRWNKPVQLPFNSDEYSVGHPALSNDGNTLYFSSDMPGSEGKADLFKVERLADGWSEPINLGDEINTPEDELFPYLSEDNVLYFSSLGHQGIGGLDIYKVDLTNIEGGVHNMGYPVNTKADDFAMVLDGDVGYLSSNREGGRGSDDIYKVNVFRYQLIANLVDAETGESVVGDITVVDDYSGEKIQSVSEMNTISIEVMKGKKLRFSGGSINYLDTLLTFSTLNIPNGAYEHTIDIPLRKPNFKTRLLYVDNYMRPTQRFDLYKGITEFEVSEAEYRKTLSDRRIDIAGIDFIRSVYYDFDKSNIREDASENLDKLVSYLEEYENLKVTLASHTDSRGSKWYNEQLAKRRAEAAKAYLMESGIAEDRILVEHHGELDLINECGNSEECNENAHQLNRRTEIYLSY
jgi:outer membrane protein OmpA-like peptidoglycan-associated protein/tetratricopeptide (TPR) repeat protein